MTHHTNPRAVAPHPDRVGWRAQHRLLSLAVAGLLLVAAACGSGSDASDDAPVGDDSAITVSELLATEPTGDVIVRAVAFDNGSGLVLCETLAESFPPQCPGEQVLIANPEVVEADVTLTSADGVRWTDQALTVSGVLTDDGFEVDTATTG